MSFSRILVINKLRNLTVKRLKFIIMGLVVSTTALSQYTSSYELEREMPVFLDKLKKELTYPLAWGNSPVKNFKKVAKASTSGSVECNVSSSALYYRLSDGNYSGRATRRLFCTKNQFQFDRIFSCMCLSVNT